MVILGIDPGNARCGWGVVRRERGTPVYVASGCIETEKALGEGARLAIVRREVQALVTAWHPDEAAVETLFFSTNVKTAIGVAQARGVIVEALTSAGVPVFNYAPQQVKQAVSAYGAAGKAQVIAMVTRLLKLEKPPTPDDAADALAVAMCHAAVPDALKESFVPPPRRSA